MTAPELLEKLATYVPVPVAHAIFHQPQPLTQPAGHRFDAAVLQVTVSGFCPLSEMLSQADAADINTFHNLLNQFFSQMLYIVQTHQGQTVKISPNTLTVIFPAHETSMQLAVRRAGECAVSMQAKMNHFAAVEIAGQPVSISTKIAIGAGQILTCSVGGVLDRWEYVVGGNPLVQVAMAERQAKAGQVVISPNAWTYVQDMFIGIPNVNSRGFVNLIRPINRLPELPPVEIHWGQLDPAEQELSQKALRAYIPKAITARLEANLNPQPDMSRLALVSVGIGGLDYEAEDVTEALQNLIQAVQEVTHRFEGMLGSINVDDKGTVIWLYFGAPPYTYADYAIRAVACALGLQLVAQEHNLRMAVGITEGIVFAGPIGAPNLQHYAVIDNQKQAATRLMQYGRDGTIIISEEVKKQVVSRFITESIGEIAVRDRDKSLPAFLVKGEHGVPGEVANRYLIYKDPLVGRKAELEQIRRMAARARAEKFQPLFIKGDLGTGKSRLAAEMVREWAREGGLVYGSKSLSYGQPVPYQSWQEILKTAFGLTASQSPQQQLDQLTAGLANLTAPDDHPAFWTERLPLLADILGLDTSENGFSQHVSRELRRNNTFATIEAILRDQTRQQPLLILLEDIHRADELSLALAAYLVHRLDDRPVLLAVTHRPVPREDLHALADIKNLPYSYTLHLDPLSHQESQDLVRILTNNTALPSEIEELLISKGKGNPFLLQEITRAVLNIANDQAKQDRDLLKTLDLPSTVQDIIQSRIDKLSEAEKLTLKIAAVIGTSFKRSLLAEVHPMPNAQLALSSQLDALAHENLLRLESPAPNWEYSFSHVVAQEVVYEGLQPSQRQQLHTVVANALEALAPDQIEQLAFHYGHSDNWDKALQYLKAAGQKAHREYANQAAIDYYSEILIHLADTQKGPGQLSAEYWDILLERAKLYNLTGQRHAESEDLGTLGLTAEALNDDDRRAMAAKQWGYFYETAGDYISSLELVERALKYAQLAGNTQLEGDAYNQLGKLLYLLGQYSVAKDFLEQALQIAQTHNNDEAQADCLNNLGMVAHFRADYDTALRLFQQAIDFWQKNDNSAGMGNALSHLGQSYYDMGQYLAAQQCYTQALDLHRKIGDRTGEALTQHNLGKIERSLGHYAKAHQLLEEAFTFYLSTGDRRHEALSLCHLGFLYFRQGKDKIALHFLKESLSILKDIDDPWFLAKALTYYGWTQYYQDQFQEAKKLITESLKIQRELHQEAAIMENMALLGKIALSTNDISLAQTCGQTILDHIEQRTTQGIEHPAMVYLACYHIFQASNNVSKAQSALVYGYQYVTMQIAQIDDPALQGHYANIPENKELLALIQK